MEIFQPASEAEVEAIVADAAAQKRTLAIEGHGSKRGLGRPIETDGTLKLARLSGVLTYEPEELVISVRAGTPLRELEAVLAEKNQCLAFEPNNWSVDQATEATIGGTIASGVAGSRRIVLGGARDHLIGFAAVNGLGEAFKAGGRVVKNVTGYDLPKLAAGSFGTLFAMTELTLRCYPHTAMPTSVVVRDLDAEEGCALLRKAVGSSWEATGFCYLPKTVLDSLGERFGASESLTIVRFEGSEESMAVRAQGFVRALAPRGSIAAGDASASFWRHFGQLNLFRTAQILWRVSLPPATVLRALKLLRPDRFAVDWAGGLLWIEHVGTAPPTVEETHAIALDLGGHATLFRAPAELRRRSAVFAPRDAATMALSQRLKRAFDPAGVFNPGRMYTGI